MQPPTMSGYRRVNYYELCRLCTSSEGNKMDIFRDEGRRRQLQSKIQTCLPVQVQEEDSLPKIVCLDCVKKLESFIAFRETVVSAESMLDSYFTSLRFSEDFLKEGKVYVKHIEKDRADSPEDPLKIETEASPAHDPILINEPLHQQQQQPVVVANLNASNIQIISGVQARVQQYKCAMQMPSGAVTAAVVEATAETHYSYQQQTSQQVSPQHHSPIGQQSRLNEQHSQPQLQVQNQMQSQSQMNHQLQRQQTNQQQQQSQLGQQQRQHQVPQQQQPQSQCEIQIHQQLREFEKHRQLQQIEKNDQHEQQQQQQQIVHQNNSVLVKDMSTDQNQGSRKGEVVSQSLNSPDENVQNFTTVQGSPEVFLSLGFKDAALSSQSSREEVKEFRDYMKSSADDALTRNSIGQISEFLRIRTCPETTPLITVNPITHQVICQTGRTSLACRDCGKTFESVNQLHSHECPNSPSMSESTPEISIKEEHIQNNSNFSCDICGKPFKRKEHLFQHRKLHTGERPYVCTTCSKAFSRKEHLVRHSVSHTGQKMHECEMCGKSFSRKDNLHKHRKTHGVAGPYICDTCGKSFVVKHYYLMHLTTHAPVVTEGDNCTDPLPYKCDLCHKAFSVKQYLTTHKLRHRSKNNPNPSNGQSAQQMNATNGMNVSGDVMAGTNNGQAADGPSVVDMQNVIDRNDSQQDQQRQQQQHNSFANNQYHGNVQQFQ